MSVHTTPPVPEPSTTARRRWPIPYGLAGLAAFALLAEAVPRLGIVPERHLPPFSRIMTALAGELHAPGFWPAVRDTVTAWSAGLGLAATAGVLVGVLIGSVPVLRDLTASTIEFLRPIPSVALIPLAVLLYGTRLPSSLLLIVYASFWPVLLQVLAGIRDIDPVAAATARSYRLGPLARLRYLQWPTTLPYAVTGLRLSASIALVLAVTAELVIGAPGLGKRIATAQISGAVPQMYALIVVTGLLGLAVNLAARAAERRVLHWHQSVRAEPAGAR